MFAPDKPKQEATTYDPYELSGAIPLVYGWNIVQGRIIENQFNYTENDDGASKPKGIWSSFAVVFCAGPIDQVDGYVINGERVGPSFNFNTWTGSDIVNIMFTGNDRHIRHELPWGDFGFYYEMSHGDPLKTHPLALLNGGTGLYWDGHDVGDGTAGCFMYNLYAPGGWMNIHAAPNIHPPYRGICHMAIHRIEGTFPKGGGGSTAMPDIQAKLFRKTKHGFPFQDNIYTGDHPYAIIYDILTDKRGGLAFGSDRVVLSDWITDANTMVSQGFYKWDQWNMDKCNLHTQINEPSDAIKVISNLLTFIDGYLYYRDGKIRIGYSPNRAVDYSSTAKVISKQYFVDPLVINREESGKVINELEIEFRNGDTDPYSLDKDSIIIRDPMKFAIAGEARKDSAKADVYIDRASAEGYGKFLMEQKSSEIGTIQAKIIDTGIRKNDGGRVVPGDVVAIDYDGKLEDMYFKVTEVDDNDKGITLKFRQLFNALPNEDSLDNDDIGQPTEHTPTAFTLYEAIQYPEILATELGGKVGILAQRSTYTTSAEVYFSSVDSFTGEESRLADKAYFASSFEATDLVESSPGVWELTFTYTDASYEVEFLNDDISEGDAIQGKFLMFIGGEILSLQEKINQGENSRTFQVRRGMYGTTVLSVLDMEGSVGYMIPKANLYVIDRYEFVIEQPYVAANETFYFKLAPVTTAGAGGAGDTFSLTLSDDSYLVTFNDEEITTLAGENIVRI